MSKKNANLLKLNYLYNLIYQIYAVIIILITTPYVSRALGAENIGIYGYTYSIVTYFILFGTLGISMYGQREIAYVKDNKEKRSTIFFELLIIKIIFILFSTIIFILLYDISGIYRYYYLILTFELFGDIFDIMWYYQGLENFKKSVIRNTIVRTISMIAIFIFVKSPNDLLKYFIILSSSSVFGNFSLLIKLNESIDFSVVKKINIKKALSKHLKAIILFFIPQISMQIYAILDKTMIGIMTNNMIDVGYYDQAQKVIRLALLIIVTFGTIIFSRMAVNYSKNDTKELNKCIDLSFDFVWLIGIPVSMGLMAITPNFVPWYFGVEFLPVVSYMMLLCPIILIIGISNVIYTQYMISTGNQKKYSLIIIVGAACNIIGNYFFIKLFGSIGVIYSSVISELTILIIEMLYCRKTIKIKDNLIDSIKYFFAGIIMFAIVLYIGKFLQSNVLSTILQIIIGVIIYFSILFILKEKTINLLIRGKKHEEI
jgi:O-antigen/teichoic acid export membrane protein